VVRNRARVAVEIVQSIKKIFFCFCFCTHFVVIVIAGVVAISIACSIADYRSHFCERGKSQEFVVAT